MLWFQPVVAGAAPFGHLVGNVAEFVWEDSRGCERTLAPGDLTAAKVGEYLRSRAGVLRVVGGSALSSPRVWDGGRERPFGRAYAVSPAEARRGFADMGFRLAFTSPAVPYSRRLRQYLDKAGYLNGAAK